MISYLRTRARVLIRLIVLSLSLFVSAALWFFYLDNQFHEQTYLQYFNDEMLLALATLFSGFFLATLSESVIKFVEERPLKHLRDVPRKFRNAAMRHLFEGGYYRQSAEFSLHLCASRLKLTATSTIIPISREAKMRPRSVQERNRINLPDPCNIRYFFDEGEVTFGDGIVPLSKPTNERLRIFFDVKTFANRKVSEIGDDHRWTSPVDCFSVSASIPSDCTIDVSALIGSDEEIILPKKLQESTKMEKTYFFTYSDPSFSYNGLRWRIVYNDNAAKVAQEEAAVCPQDENTTESNC